MSRAGVATTAAFFKVSICALHTTRPEHTFNQYRAFHVLCDGATLIGAPTDTTCSRFNVIVKSHSPVRAEVRGLSVELSEVILAVDAIATKISKTQKCELNRDPKMNVNRKSENDNCIYQYNAEWIETAHR